MRGIHYFFLRFGLIVLFLLVTSPILFSLLWLIRFVEAHEEYDALGWVLLPIVLVYVFGLPWLANKTAQQMAFENRKLGAAVRIVFCDLRLCLGFLPLIGHWFEPRSTTEADDDDELRQDRDNQ